MGPIDAERQPILTRNDDYNTIETGYTPTQVPDEGTGDETSTAEVIDVREGIDEGVTMPMSLCLSTRRFVLVAETTERPVEGYL